VRKLSRRRAWVRGAKAFVFAVALLLACAAALHNLLTLKDREAEPFRYVRVSGEPLTPSLEPPEPFVPTLAGAAYRSIARELPGTDPGSVRYVQQSVLDPSWASVRFAVPGRGEDHYYALFLRKSGEEWRAGRSVIVEGRREPDQVKAVLESVPKDLVTPLFLEESPERGGTPAQTAVSFIERATGREDEWEPGSQRSSGDFFKVRVESEKDRDLFTDVYMREEGDHLSVIAAGRDITTAEAVGFPPDLAPPANMPYAEKADYGPPEVVTEGNLDRERMEDTLEEAVREAEDYPGVVGFYVRDLESGSGYGVRSDRPFFSASTIKIPVMIAVYRRIETGDLDHADTFKTAPEDYAAGAGWMQWNPPGTKTTVQDSLWLMMTQSDNVATNALIRLVGGPDYVNEVARSMGATGTVLGQKVSSERGAIPHHDNRTTPRDMALMMESIASGKAASAPLCREMIELMRQNEVRSWVKDSVPQGARVANKGGWLSSVYNDVAIVEHERQRYAVAILTQYGPVDVEKGGETVEDISRALWLAQSGEPPEKGAK
jgi:beta-lactamase class A